MAMKPERWQKVAVRLEPARRSAKGCSAVFRTTTKPTTARKLSGSKSKNDANFGIPMMAIELLGAKKQFTIRGAET
jgi:hypothetical protein